MHPYLSFAQIVGQVFNEIFCLVFDKGFWRARISHSNVWARNRKFWQGPGLSYFLTREIKEKQQKIPPQQKQQNNLRNPGP